MRVSYLEEYYSGEYSFAEFVQWTENVPDVWRFTHVSLPNLPSDMIE